ncbi:type II toxin-antitoxin system VapB family antitoxin [Glaciihabitans sp. UYNi722]|uniref:type II toxin-antitoxin system VapB family antitoxin n=1 Tax=Glaciihabitans sp. UYNi722 TaxID=3156344 RepID=UPI0033971E04
MSLNIKNQQTHDLVRELAMLTGVSQTQAVEEAVRARLVELRPEEAEAKAERMLAIARQVSARLGPRSAVDHAELLYDESGLPQ